MNSVSVKAHRRAAWPMPDKLDDWRSWQIALARYAFCSQFAKGKKLLDIACGGGYGSYYLSDKGAQLVVGGDMWPEAVQYATHCYGGESTHFLRLDACHLPFPTAYFDVVASFETIRYMPDPAQFVVECLRVLKSGGLFVCSTPNREATSNESHTELVSWAGNEFNRVKIQELLDKYLMSVQVYDLNPVPSGNGKAGRLASWGGKIVLSLGRIPGVIPLVNLVVGLFYPKYRLVCLEKVADWEGMLDPALKPYLLQDGARPGTCLVALGRKPDTISQVSSVL